MALAGRQLRSQRDGTAARRTQVQSAPGCVHKGTLLCTGEKWLVFYV